MVRWWDLLLKYYQGYWAVMIDLVDHIDMGARAKVLPCIRRPGGKEILTE